MQCLIIAAGRGSRLRALGEVKPLVPLLGVPLLERVIRSLQSAGVDRFVVVTGYEGDRVETFLKRLAERLGTEILCIRNEAWEKENGVSVLLAREVLGEEPFLLSMADHLFDPAIARALLATGHGPDEVLLAVDPNLSNPLVDMEDVTRVACDQKGNIRAIGKGLERFDGFDTGVFLCTPAIFDALERSCREQGDTTLSGAIRILAAEGKALGIPIDRFWIDVDDERAFRKAEEALLEQTRGKGNDGPVSRWLNRPLSIRLSRWLVRYDITPNQISLFSFLLSLLAACLFAVGGYVALALGGLIAQLASVIDGSDGEVARLKYLSSDYGGWFDAVLDRYADAFLLFGLTWHVYQETHTPLSLVAGFLAIIGSFMVSYTADKYDQRMKERIGKGFRIGRDIRVFLIFLGAVLDQPLPLLVAIALLMNGETVRRLVICRE